MPGAGLSFRHLRCACQRRRGHVMYPSLSAQEFVAKWQTVELKKRSASQSHFNDLCRLVGHPTPVALLDAYGSRRDLSDEEILERLLGLNLERAGM